MRTLFPRWFVFSSALFLLGLSSTDAFAETDSCISHPELNDWHLSNDTIPVVCDWISKVYFESLGLPFRDDLSSHPEENRPELVYYYEFRSYLEDRGERQDELSIEEIAFLLAGVALLPDGLVYYERQDNRTNYYTAFAHLEFWEHRNDDLTFMRTTLLARGNGLFRYSQLNDRKALTCFVKFDVPTLPISDILASRAYSACVSFGS